MATPGQREHENNPNMMMLRLNEWHNSNRYRDCTIVKLAEHRYKLLYGSEKSYTAWVLVELINDKWTYSPLGNSKYRSDSYQWLGDLFDDAIEAMIQSKL